MELLIHVCCADCLLKVLDSIGRYNDVPKIDHMTFYFYNPNIHPRTEYLARLKALQETVKKITDIQYKIIIPDMSPKEYFRKISLGLSFPAQNVRCPLCWELRLRKSFEYAREHKISLVTTTLLSSKYQDENTIIQIATNLSKEYNITFWIPEKLDKDMHNQGFYKQNYCGCCFSLVEKNLENVVKSSN